MTSSALDDGPEPPLDPAMERVQRKLRKLVLVSGLIMAAGLVAVFAAILYRLSEAENRRAPATVTLDLPQGTTVQSATGTADRLTLVVESPDGKTSIVVFDAATGQPLTTFTLGTAGQPSVKIAE
ncbi:DUF6476 family protein [Amorphus sp. 3PC139-8]|uniref:DUF6476 family protein n=1 Tax=Amorphus sp. 3PC139-8 TaxID=2735676 RepID=UPI00345CEF88